ncbi:MAG: hypothetical protein Q7K29_09170, partial [Thermoleophilia bacterium]|nr:hypothetical protein [Thermoleophilia bacterium]
MNRLQGTPVYRRLSTKMIAGFIAIVAIFSILGLVVTREVSETRNLSDDAMDRAEAVQHMEEAKSAAAEQIQAHYELILENNEGKIASFEAARSRRQSAISEARVHAGTPQEVQWFDELELVSSRFDDNFLNKLVPAWRSGDQSLTLTQEKEADGLLLLMGDYSSLLSTNFKARNFAAQEAADAAATEAQAFMIFAAIAGIGLSLII